MLHTCMLFPVNISSKYSSPSAFYDTVGMMILASQTTGSYGGLLTLYHTIKTFNDPERAQW